MKTRVQSQRGVAAIEFAIVFMALFAVLYGIATWGAALYIHQVVARAANDGARAAATTAVGNDARGAAVQSARRSLAASLVVPLGHSTSPSTRLAWINAHVSVQTTLPSTGQLMVHVSYPYADYPLLPALSFFEAVMPKTLTSRATTALPS